MDNIKVYILFFHYLYVTQSCQAKRQFLLIFSVLVKLLSLSISFACIYCLILFFWLFLFQIFHDRKWTILIGNVHVLYITSELNEGLFQEFQEIQTAHTITVHKSCSILNVCNFNIITTIIKRKYKWDCQLHVYWKACSIFLHFILQPHFIFLFDVY